MLTYLHIENIVLIRSQELDFCAGLCVLTGETGAGKSILLDSLGLVMGNRADNSLVAHGQTQGEVTAEFDIRHNIAARQALEELGWAAEDTLILRRSISAEGKSRAYINDKVVSVTALKTVGQHLVEIYGQHDQRSLMEVSSHRTLLDAFGRHDAALKEVGQAWRHYADIQKQLEQLHEQAEQARREEEYLRHIAKELKALSPKAGEEEALTHKRTNMMQSEKLYDVLNEAISQLNADNAAASGLRAVQRTLLRSSLNQDGRFDAVVEALEKAAHEAEMAAEQLEEMGQNTAYDPDELERAEERLFALKAAGRKYNLPVEELPQLQQETEAKLALITHNSKKTQVLQKELAAARECYCGAAENLRSLRKQTAASLEKAVEDELGPLKMGSTRFHVAIEPAQESQWSAHGMDAIAFEAATNISKSAAGNIAYAPIGKIASGGELSRFMLAFKVALRGVRSLPTLIFDEIDTGTGGAVADAIGKRLSELGKNVQVLVVTHLPQVAARGVQHWQVSKVEDDRGVFTQVVPLSAKARKEELARMLAGSKITPEARKAAEKLLEQAA